MSDEIEPLLPGIKLESPTNILVSYPSAFENEYVQEKSTAECNTSDSENSADETCIKSPISLETSESYDTSEFGNIKWELPVGKKYHLFVAHSTEDKVQVNEICQRLESRFRIKCLNFESDFVGGVPLENNIRRCMDQSVKVVLMISSSFFESYWCMFEAHEALAVYNKTKKNCVIPVLLRQTENDLPGYLKHLRYIDGEKESDIAAKIYDAFHFSDEFTRRQEDQVYTEEETRNQNGARLLSKAAIRQSSFCRRGHVYEIPDINSQDNKILINFQNCEEQLGKAIECVNDHNLMKHYRVFVGGMYTFIASTLLSLITLALNTLTDILEIIIKRQFDGIPVISILVAIGLAGLVWICSFLGIARLRRQLTERLRMILWRINDKYFETSKCFIDFDNTLLSKPCLTVIRYDTTECKKHLCNLLKSRCIILGDESRERHADDMIRRLLRNMQVKGSLCNWSSLDVYDYNRHNTWLRKKCLCQILEDEIIKSVECA